MQTALHVTAPLLANVINVNKPADTVLMDISAWFAQQDAILALE